jgi:hypothetical protein
METMVLRHPPAQALEALPLDMLPVPAQGQKILPISRKTRNRLK